MRIVMNALGAALILLIGAGGFVMFGQKPDVPRTDSDQSDAGVPVETAEVVAWDQPLVVTVDGEAVTYRVVTVGAEVAGRIVEKAEQTRGGTMIDQGTPLFRIDDRNYRLDVERLTAEQQKAEAEVQAVAVDLQNTEELIALAKEEWQLQQNQFLRIKSAFDRDATTETELDTAQRQELAARHALQTLQNQMKTLAQEQKTRQAALELADAQRKRAEVDLARCVVVAPISGTIVDDLVEQGDYIKAGDPLVHISDSSRMEVKCQLQADELNWILQQPLTTSEAGSSAGKLAMPQVACEVAYDLNAVEAVWDGVLSRYEGTGMDRDTRTFPCRVLVEQPRNVRLSDSAGGRPIATPPTLLSGMFVTVRIPVTSPVPLLRVPVEAIRPGGQLWVVDDDTLQIRNVSVAETVGDWAVVRAGDSALRAGDRVVISPLASVTDGMTVAAERGSSNMAARPSVDTPSVPSPESRATPLSETTEVAE